MAKIKLTEKQLSVLRELAKPKACAHYHPYMGNFNPNAYWTVNGEQRTQAVSRLIDCGFLDERDMGDWRGGSAVISDAGREFLATQPDEQPKKPTKWYGASNKYGLTIDDVDVIRSTDSMIVMLLSNGQERTAKIWTEWTKYYPSREEAIDHIRKRVLMKISEGESARKEFNKLYPSNSIQGGA